MSTTIGGTITWNLDADISKFEKGLNDASNIAENAGKSIDDKLKGVGQSISNTLKDLGSNMTNLGRDMSIAFTAPITALGASAVSATEIAGRYSSVLDAFKSMTKSMGIDAEKFQKDVSAATGNQLDNLTILQGATRGLSLIGKEAFNNFGGDFVKMAELSKKAARATGQDVDFMFNSLVLGISRESKLILDNLGISVDITAVKEEYAKSIGKETDALTQSENKHAVLNAVLNKLQATYGEVRVSAGGFQGAMQQLKTEITNATISVGTELEPELAKLTKELVQLIKDILPSLINTIRNVITWFTNLSPTMQKVILGVIAFAAIIGPVLVALGLFIGAIGGLIGALSALAPIGGAIAGIIGAISAPVLLVIAAITALIAVGVLLYKNWDVIKAAAFRFGNDVYNSFSRLKNGIIDSFDQSIQRAVDFKNRYFEVLTGIVDFVKMIFTGDYKSSIARAFGIYEDQEPVRSILRLRERVMNIFNEVINFLRNIRNAIVDAITWPFREALNIVQDLASRIKSALDQINPFHRNSPSLVDNVIAGVKEIKKQYQSLDSINLPQISSQSLPLTDIGQSQNYSKKDVTVNIGTVRSSQDVDMISREIGYRLSLI